MKLIPEDLIKTSKLFLLFVPIYSKYFNVNGYYQVHKNLFAATLNFNTFLKLFLNSEVYFSFAQRLLVFGAFCSCAVCISLSFILCELSE
jgi:hypothetical protein